MVTFTIFNEIAMPLRKDINQDIIARLLQFRDERDWSIYHKPKDLAIALSIESNELLECFLWKNDKEACLSDIKEELADVFSYAFLLLQHYQLDLSEIMQNKIILNEKKYPVNKTKGNAKKYNQL